MAYLWSEDAQRFRDEATGRFVSDQAINQAVDAVILAASLRMVGITTDLQNGAITLAEWQQRIIAEMKPLHLGAAALGRGGWAQMGFSDYGWTGMMLRRQYGYLRNFAQDIATGRQPMDGRVIARVRLYASAARVTLREMQRRSGQLAGRMLERNQLGVAEHCRGCKYATSLGWVPIGTLTPIGARQCRTNCKCRIETKAA